MQICEDYLNKKTAICYFDEEDSAATLCLTPDIAYIIFNNETSKLVKRIDEYRSHYPISMQIHLLYFSQKIFVDWLDEVLAIYRQATKIAVLMNINSTSISEIQQVLRNMGAAEDNIILCANMLTSQGIAIELGFSPQESIYGMVADYIYANIAEYKISDRAEILTLIKPILSDCIINYRKDAFTDILVWLKANILKDEAEVRPKELRGINSETSRSKIKEIER